MDYEPLPDDLRSSPFVRHSKYGKALRNFTGIRLGRLLIVRLLGVTRNPKGHIAQTVWWVECDCGTKRPMGSGSFKRAVSCGCFRKEHFTAKLFKHGACATRAYSSWKAMINRCTNPKNVNYHLYGGRGVTVCARWRESFADFLEDLGERPPGKTVDRKDSNLGYEPGNCQWSTPREQQLNRRNTIVLTYEGTTQPLSVWAEQMGVQWRVIYLRIQRGWSVARALTAPLVYKRKTRAAV